MTAWIKPCFYDSWYHSVIVFVAGLSSARSSIHLDINQHTFSKYWCSERLPSKCVLLFRDENMVPLSNDATFPRCSVRLSKTYKTEFTNQRSLQHLKFIGDMSYIFNSTKIQTTIRYHKGTRKLTSRLRNFTPEDFEYAQNQQCVIVRLSFQ